LFFSFLFFIASFSRSKLIFNSLFLITGVFYVLNFGFGYDWMNYYDSYLNINTPGYDFFFYEPGYLWCMSLFSYFGVDFQIFYGLTVLFIYFSVYKFCIKTKSPAIAFFTLFCFLGFYVFSEGIRQGVAFSICLFALNALRSNLRLRAIVIISVASLFHASSLFTFLYFILLNPGQKSFYRFTITSTTFVALFLFFLYNPSYLSFIPVVGPKFAIYSSMYAWADGGFVDWLLKSRVFFLYIFFLLMLFLFQILQKKNRIYSAISVVYFLTLSRMTPVLLRFGYYLPPVLVLSMDNYLDSKGRDGHFSLFKLAYLSILLIISTMPFWDYTYMKGADYHVNILSSKADIESVINIKCNILNRNEINGVIRRCMW
ncbi:TPA: EpsG family protein, partial [Klebsiella pneumoniae]|nr:EpsG family protein [Klebsiella pneumoniae]